jgi:alkaline phosphatase D
MRHLVLLLSILFAPSANYAQRLKAGPMVGHVHMMEANIWLQTTPPGAQVQIAYWDTTGVGTNRGLANKKGRIKLSKKYATHADNDHIAQVVLGRLEPGTTYAYQVLLNGKPVSLAYPTLFKTQKIWLWRTDPPEFSVAMGSCTYINDSLYDRPGKPYGSSYGIFEEIRKKQPDLMLWLGDNYYYREADWYSETGMRHRASHSRSVPEMQPLLAATQHYAIWDDHDFGPNDSDRSYVLKETAREIFSDYWVNPTYGLDGKEGITTMFQYADVDFFLMDNRWFRSPNRCKACPNKQYFGKEQIDWLVENLANSFAPFKVIASGGMILSSHKGHENFINLAPDERDYLFKRIDEEQIKGVVFVTGDVHYSELSQAKTPAGITLIDMTTSPLTSGVYSNPKDQNDNRVAGTQVSDQHTFTILKFSGKRKERKMEISLCGENGSIIWSKVFEAEK